jgi:TorA maturation chaperone TorD
MKAEMESLTSLLAQLWLHEPDAETAMRAVSELGLPEADPAGLASAYSDVFLLNVYPYGTAFTDPSGELNGLRAQNMAALYEARAYNPPELAAVGAPDHVGLCLGFARHIEALGQTPLAGDALAWIPVCCLAVEREPSAHPFYRALAVRTREWLMARSQFLLTNGDLLSALRGPLSASDEVSLRDLVRFWLAPARCGLFLSRSRLGQMANRLGMRLPFGSRFDVAEMLFAWAGETGQIEGLIGALKDEVEGWQSDYRAWTRQHPEWRPFGDAWLMRTAEAARTLAEMQQMAETESA